MSIEDKEERRRLQREVIHSRGEILFSKALILCEGETEEQALPVLFEKYFESECFVLGVSVIGVGGSGKKYLPFLKFAKDFEIPVFIFSDGELRPSIELRETYSTVYGETDITNCNHITILEDTDFEGYIISSGFKSIIESVICQEKGENYIQSWINDQRQKYEQDNTLKDYTGSGGYEKALIKIIKDKIGKTKSAPLIAEKLYELEKRQLPLKFLEFFHKIKVGAGI